MTTLEDRFWSKVAMIPEHPCWEWVGARDPCGYGRLSVGSGKYDGAHRVSLLLRGASLGPGDYVLHLCDNPGCVNPAHLIVGTQRDNVLQSVARGRWGNRRAGRYRIGVGKVTMALNLLGAGVYQHRIARQLGISQATVSRIMLGQRLGKDRVSRK